MKINLGKPNLISCKTVSSCKHRAGVESTWVKFAVRCDEYHKLGNYQSLKMQNWSLKMQNEMQKLEETDTGFERNALEVDIPSEG